MQEELSLRDYLAIARRRWPFVLLPFVVVLVGSVGVALALPPVYQASGTILVESQQIPDQLVLSTVTGLADERIEIIKQRVMTRDNLLAIAEKFHVFADDHGKLARSEMVDEMRERITVELIGSDSQRRGKTTISFKLSFEDRRPEVAYQVTNELVTLFLDENVKARTQRASETTDFLAQEADKLKSQLDGLEEQIADYKQEHKDALPEHLQLHTGMLERAQLESREISLQLKELEQEQRFLDVEMSAARSGIDVGERADAGVRVTPAGELMRLKAELAQKSAIYQTSHPDIVTLQRQVAALESVVGTTATTEAEVAAAQGELALAQSRYGPGHPDVKKLRARVAELQAQAGKGAATQPTDSADVQAARIGAKMAAVTDKMATLQAQQAAAKAKIAELEDRILQTPQVERGLLALTRDHENSLSKYEEIKAKQLQAQLAENLEEDKKAERFVLLEPPLKPDKPIKPNRKKALATGFALAAASGGGSLMLVESMNESIRGPASLAKLLRQPPLVVIPYLETASELRRRRRRLVRLAVAALLLGLLAIAAIHLFYMPLDTLWLKVLDRLNAM